MSSCRCGRKKLSSSGVCAHCSMNRRFGPVRTTMCKADLVRCRYCRELVADCKGHKLVPTRLRRPVIGVKVLP